MNNLKDSITWIRQYGINRLEADTLLNHSDPFNFLGIYLTVIVIFLDITGLSWGICI